MVEEIAAVVFRRHFLEWQVIVDLFLSVSFIAALPDTERSKVAQQLIQLSATRPEIRGHETIAFPYETRAYCCDRL
jgi:hypothetical protein